jgi:HEAT repeat protein
VTHPTKRALRDLLQRGQLERIAGRAAETKRVLGDLVSLTFDADPEIGWRAVEALGLAAARLSGDHPDHVRELLRRLYWLLSEESGGVCWRAPEAMAEIVARCPDVGADYVPIVASLIVSLEPEDLERFRAGALWALGRLASVAGAHAGEACPAAVAALDHPDSQVRGMAVWALTALGAREPLTTRVALLRDNAPVDLYEDRALRRVTVGELARRALEPRSGSAGSGV